MESGLRVSKLEVGVNKFKSEEKKTKDQLEWWKSHHEQFPLLSYLVRCVFAVPVASPKSERVFSIAGLLVTAIWNRLDPETVESGDCEMQPGADQRNNVVISRYIVYSL